MGTPLFSLYFKSPAAVLRVDPGIRGAGRQAESAHQKRDSGAQSKGAVVGMVENVRMHFDICIFIDQAFIECLLSVLVANGGEWSGMWLEDS